jgi:hypothetical protein
MTTPNEIANEARELAGSPAVSPGAQPSPLILAELVRNLASLVSELAAYVEQATSE